MEVYHLGTAYRSSFIKIKKNYTQFNSVLRIGLALSKFRVQTAEQQCLHSKLTYLQVKAKRSFHAWCGKLFPIRHNSVWVHFWIMTDLRQPVGLKQFMSLLNYKSTQKNCYITCQELVVSYEMKKGIAKQLIWISDTQKMRFYFMCWEYCEGQKVKETSPEQLFSYLSVCPHVRCCHSCANSGDIMDQSNEEQYSLSDLCCTNNSRSAHSYSWPCGHIAFLHFYSVGCVWLRNIFLFSSSHITLCCTS